MAVNFEHYTPEVEQRLLDALEACGPQAVAWGECGLDYNKRKPALDKDDSIRDRMRQVFVQQARLAVQRGLPIVVHSRDAVPDVLAVLHEIVPKHHPVHMHSFMGTPEEMNEFLKSWPCGYVGITGAVTWSIAETIKGGLGDLCRALPLDRLLLETDGPYMAPMPYRGQESHPGLVPWIAGGVAKAKGQGLTAAEVATAAHQNFCQLY